MNEQIIIFSQIVFIDLVLAGDNAIIMYTQGATGLNIGNSTWVGSLADVSEHRGYWLIVGESDNLQVQGIPTAPVSYTVTEGNNLISYPYLYEQGLSSGLDGTGAEGSLFAIYGEGEAAIVEDGVWLGALDGFQGGSGYWFVANQDFQFEYNEPTPGAFSRTPQLERPEHLVFKQSMNQYFYFYFHLNFSPPFGTPPLPILTKSRLRRETRFDSIHLLD